MKPSPCHHYHLFILGHYECVNGQNVFCFWKINVHDPNEMVYVMTSRGQKPWEDTVSFLLCFKFKT